jgi:hypothetical protein
LLLCCLMSYCFCCCSCCCGCNCCCCLCCYSCLQCRLLQQIISYKHNFQKLLQVTLRCNFYKTKRLTNTKAARQCKLQAQISQTTTSDNHKIKIAQKTISDKHCKLSQVTIVVLQDRTPTCQTLIRL